MTIALREFGQRLDGLHGQVVVDGQPFRILDLDGHRADGAAFGW